MDKKSDTGDIPVIGNQRKLAFISEGTADIEGQKNSEEQAQNKFENEKLRRSRKSLSDQLRSNAALKQKEYRKQVKRREKFNRLDKDELKFFKDIEDNERREEKEMESYLNNKLTSFERKKKLMERNKSSESAATPTTPVPESSSINNKIVKKKAKKIKVKISGSLNSK
ncbi:hypothetical protein C6P45_000509 [Maudiozyma exigua]|uniref:FAM192A/Fyv6 N-terminal domain-containing protein n=1 Tax=Maudiozyma exigua TaxID=34358 RepID=A0A9P6W7R9_MAUEX|nr:hypothetical protein C6P45_000509 [Kazachstania exigua]